MITSTTPGTPSSPTRLTARTPEDLLAVVPVVLGFWPTDSVVMLTFGAEQPFHARVDLPDDPLAMPGLGAVLVAPAAHHRVERVVLLLYSGDDDLVDVAWQALSAAFHEHSIEVADALWVGEGRWFPLLHGDPAARAVGTAYDQHRVAAHPFLAQSVLDGRVTHGSRTELAATLEPVPTRVAAVEAEVGAWPPDPPPDPPDELAEGTWVHALVERHVAEQTRLGDVDAARLLLAMRSLLLRDAAWAALGRSRSRAAVAFLTDLARRSPRPLLPPVAALLAWSAWQAGDGALAWCAIDRCLDVDPDYRLAGLVAEALERAVPPSVCDDGFDWKGGLTTR